MTGKQFAKGAAVVGGMIGAATTVLASGGTALVAILAALAAGTTGVGTLYMEPPGKKKTAGKGQAVDYEIPRELRKPGAT